MSGEIVIGVNIIIWVLLGAWGMYQFSKSKPPTCAYCEKNCSTCKKYKKYSKCQSYCIKNKPLPPPPPPPPPRVDKVIRIIFGEKNDK